MLTLLIIISAAITIYALNQYHKWQLSFYREEVELLELENRLQAERIQELERERGRLHFQLLAHLSEPGQQVNVYRN